MSTLVKFEAADFETALSNARTAVADTSERLAELKAAGPASLPTLKGALKHVTPIRTRLVEQRRITKRAIDDLAGDLLKRVAEVEDPLQHAIREIEAKELNEAARGRTSSTPTPGRCSPRSSTSNWRRFRSSRTIIRCEREGLRCGWTAATGASV